MIPDQKRSASRIGGVVLGALICTFATVPNDGWGADLEITRSGGRTIIELEIRGDPQHLQRTITVPDDLTDIRLNFFPLPNNQPAFYRVDCTADYREGLRTRLGQFSSAEEVRAYVRDVLRGNQDLAAKLRDALFTGNFRAVVGRQPAEITPNVRNARNAVTYSPGSCYMKESDARGLLESVISVFEAFANAR